jgi:hypothetical protein
MDDLFTPDPEGDPQEEADLTFRLLEAVHLFKRGPDGKCTERVRKFCYEHNVIDFHNPCRADRWSVLHR